MFKKQVIACPVGPMDKASVYGTGDSGFDPQAGFFRNSLADNFHLFFKSSVDIYIFSYFS